MKSKAKIVSRTPLNFLWKDQLVLSLKRGEFLRKSQVEELLKHEPVEFVIASIGSPLSWIDIEKCYDLWEKELKSHLVEDYDEFDLDDYKNHYAYVASEWIGEDKRLILLEVFH